MKLAAEEAISQTLSKDDVEVAFSEKKLPRLKLEDFQSLPRKDILRQQVNSKNK